MFLQLCLQLCTPLRLQRRPRFTVGLLPAHRQPINTFATLPLTSVSAQPLMSSSSSPRSRSNPSGTVVQLLSGGWSLWARTSTSTSTAKPASNQASAANLGGLLLPSLVWDQAQQFERGLNFE